MLITLLVENKPWVSFAPEVTEILIRGQSEGKAIRKGQDLQPYPQRVPQR